MASEQQASDGNTTLYDEGTLQAEHRADEVMAGRMGPHGPSSTLLNAELSSMISLLRRQMSSARFFSDTSPISDLLEEFGKTRTSTMDPRKTLSRMEGLEPFIKLFKSQDVTGHIVMGALESARRLLFSTYFPALPDSREDLDAFQALFDAISKCRFEATDLNMDEIALMKLTGTLLDALRHPLATHLTDSHVCTAVETTFRLCFQSRFSEILRQTSCFTAIGMVQEVFLHLPRLIKTGNIEVLAKLKPIALPFSKVADGVETPALETKEESTTVLVSSPPIIGTEPFSISSLCEILRFLAKLLDGSRLDDRGRILAANSIGIIIEGTVDYLQESPQLFRIFSNEISKNLFALINVNTTPLVLRHLIHPIAALFRLYRRYFVAQFGFLLETLIEVLGAKHVGTVPKIIPRYIESKTILLELMLEFVEDENLMGDLYVFYECDQRYPMVLSQLVSCLCDLAKNSDTKNGGSESTALLAMQMLNRMMYELAMHGKQFKMEGGLATETSSPKSGSMDYAEQRRTKMIVQEAVSLYNAKPKDAFAFLIRQGLLSEPPTVEELAKFLRRTPGLDKRTMGEYLAKEGNEPILRAFMSDFAFQPEATIDAALRQVLESFRLPGEAQMIDRVVESFANVYFDTVGKDQRFATVDATHILAFSIIMLNTDLYNPQNQRRMTMEEFIKNNRGINDRADFDHGLLRHIYKTIAEREIVMPEEVQGSEHTWKEVISKADGYVMPNGLMSALPLPNTPQHIPGILSLLFQPLLNCYLAPSQREPLRSDEVSKLSFAGLDLLSRVLSDLELHPLMAELMEALWQATGIPVDGMASSAASPRPSSPNAPPVSPPQQGKARTIRLVARSENCRMTLQTLFGIVQVSGPSLRAGWRTVCSALFAFAEAGLLHLEMVDPGLGEEIRKATSLVVKPATPFDSPNEAGGVVSGGSYFSAFSSYIVSSNNNQNAIEASTGDEPVDPELKRRALKVVRETCQLDRILQETRYFQSDSLHALLQALSQGLLHSSSSSSFKDSEQSALVVLLELAVYVAWQNRDRLAMFWPSLSSCLADLSKLPRKSLCEHAVMGLGRICLWLSDRTDVADPVVDAPSLYFQVLCHVAPETFQYIAEPAMSLALRITRSSKPSLTGSSHIWAHYFTLLSQSSRLRSCDPSTFGLLAFLIPKNAEDPLLLPLEFFTEYIDLLIAFIGNSISVPPGKVTPLSLASKESVIYNPPTGSGDSSPSPSESSLSMATECLDSLLELQNRLVSDGSMDNILHLHLEVAKLCTHSSRLLRQQCLSLLQRLILSFDFSLNLDLLRQEFSVVLLPLLGALHQVPDPSRRVMDAFEETQMRASGIMCKILLQHLPLLLEEKNDEQFKVLWTSIIESLLRLMEGRSDILRESIPESIKNMLLVMATSGPLSLDTDTTPPPNVTSFWNETWSLLDPIIPRLHQDLTATLDQANAPEEPARRSSSAHAIEQVIEKTSGMAIEEVVVEPVLDGQVEPKFDEVVEVEEDEQSSHESSASDIQEEETEVELSTVVEEAAAEQQEPVPNFFENSQEQPDLFSSNAADSSTDQDRPTTLFEV